MRKANRQSEHTHKIVLLSLLTAMVGVLAYYGGFLNIGGLASVSLTLIPVVIGSILCGPKAGAWLGGVSGAVFFITADAPFWLGLSIPGTIITVMVKGICCGMCAGLVYLLLERFNRYLAVVASAVVCPVVNTGIFIIGSLIFFSDTVSAGAVSQGLSTGMYLILFFVGRNFIFELLLNILVSPAIVRIIDVAQKRSKP